MAESTPKNRSWTLRVVRVLLVIELVWVVGANLLLSSDLLPELINRKPEKFSVHWESARSWWPGRIRANGFVYQQHTWTMDIEARAISASASLRVLPLLALRLVLDDVDAHDVAVALHRKVPEGERPVPTKTEPGIRLALEDIEVHGIEQISFDDVTVTGGQPSLKGNLAFQVRGDVAFPDLALDWRDARIMLGEQTVAESIALGFRGEVAPFHPKRDKGLALVRKITGELDVEGRSESLRPLQVLLPRLDWIEKLDGAGDVALHLDVLEGQPQPGSEVEVVAPRLELAFLGFVADGSGRVDFDVLAEGPVPLGQVDVLFDRFGLSRRGEAKPLARGSGLSLTARGEDFLREGVEGLSVELHIPDSEVPDVSVLADGLAPGLGIAIDGGRAVLSGELEASGRGEEASGSFAIRGTDLEGRFRDLDFGMDLAFDTQISGRDLDAFEVQLEGTQVRLFNGVFDGEETEVEEGWWMTIGVPEGRANLVPPVTAEARLDLSMRDTRAIIALFTEVKRWIRHFEGFLTVRDVDGHASLRVEGPRVSVRELALEGDRLDFMAELELEEEELDGIVWGKLGVFSLGMERLDAETDFKLVNGREWYEEQRGSRWRDPQGKAIDPMAGAADAP